MGDLKKFSGSAAMSCRRGRCDSSYAGNLPSDSVRVTDMEIANRV